MDLWEIRKENTITSLDLTTMLQNYNLFSGQFIRDASGAIVQIDQRWVNAGSSITRGLEVGANANGTIWNGKWTAAIDGSYLIEKKSRPTANAAYGESEVGRFTFTGDLGLRWKHTAYVTYTEGNWTTMLSQIFRSGYKDQVLPGVLNGLVSPSDYNPNVKSYSIFNLSATYSGIKNMTLTAGSKTS
jgi:iron complex outermembrane receptor protein